jgi:hypothetical protein
LQGTIARCLPLLGWGIGGLGSSIVISSFLYPHSWMFNPELIIGSESQILDRQLHFVGIFFDHDAPEAHSCPLSHLITRKRFSHLKLIMTKTPDEPRRKLKVMVITMGGPRQEMSRWVNITRYFRIPEQISATTMGQQHEGWLLLEHQEPLRVKTIHSPTTFPNARDLTSFLSCLARI